MTPWLSMAQNNAWANATLHAALADLSPEDFAAPRPGFFPSLRSTVTHILSVDLYYLDALERGGQGDAARDVAVIDDGAALTAAQAAADRRLVAICRDLTEARLAATVCTLRDGERVHETVGPLLLHLFQHQIHHRGQAHVQLQEAGVVPPQLDEFHLEFDRAPTARAFRD